MQMQFLASNAVNFRFAAIINLISIHTINQELTECHFMKTTMKRYDGMVQKVSQIFLPKAYYITKDGQPDDYFVNADLGLVLVKH